MRNSRRSWPLRTTSISPVGRPPSRGSGSEIAQRSKKLTIDGVAQQQRVLARERRPGRPPRPWSVRRWAWSASTSASKSASRASMARIRPRALAHQVDIVGGADMSAPRSMRARTFGSMSSPRRVSRSRWMAKASAGAMPPLALTARHVVEQRASRRSAARRPFASASIAAAKRCRRCRRDPRAAGPARCRGAGRRAARARAARARSPAITASAMRAIGNACFASGPIESSVDDSGNAPSVGTRCGSA